MNRIIMKKIAPVPYVFIDTELDMLVLKLWQYKEKNLYDITNYEF